MIGSTALGDPSASDSDDWMVETSQRYESVLDVSGAGDVGVHPMLMSVNGSSDSSSQPALRSVHGSSESSSQPALRSVHGSSESSSQPALRSMRSSSDSIRHPSLRSLNSAPNGTSPPPMPLATTAKRGPEPPRDDDGDAGARTVDGLLIAAVAVVGVVVLGFTWWLLCFPRPRYERCENPNVIPVKIEAPRVESQRPVYQEPPVPRAESQRPVYPERPAPSAPPLPQEYFAQPQQTVVYPSQPPQPEVAYAAPSRPPPFAPQQQQPMRGSGEVLFKIPPEMRCRISMAMREPAG